MAVIHPDSQRLSDRFHTRGNPKVIICICFLLQSLGLPCRASAQVCVTDPMFYPRVRGGMLLEASRRVQYAALIKKTGWLPCIIETLTSAYPYVCCVEMEKCRIFSIWQSVIKHAENVRMLIIILTCTANFHFGSSQASTQAETVDSNRARAHTNTHIKSYGDKRLRNPWSSWAVSWPPVSSNGSPEISQVVLEWQTPWLCIRIQRSPKSLLSFNYLGVLRRMG